MTGETKTKLSPHATLTAAVLLLLVAIAARAQTFGNPVLGFDEQFYLLVGDRMLNGSIPFVDIFDRKPIGLFLIYAFIRLLGGEGTLQYQMVAGLFAWGTAFTVWRFARRLAPASGALAAGVAYLLWLDFLEGEAGQAPVFFNLPVVIAALLTERAVTTQSVRLVSGLVPMVLVGIAIQIKYTALFEGVFFGLSLLLTAWRMGTSGSRLAGLATAWILAALAPTLAAYLTYDVLGHADAFLFANFVSMWGKLPDPFATSAYGLLTIFAVLSPLLVCSIFPPATQQAEQARSRRFAIQWLVAAILGMLAMRSFSTPQYAMPVLAPAVITAASRLGAFWRDSRIAWAGLLVAAIASQFVLHSLEVLKGGSIEAHRLAVAAAPGKGCLFVYDGYPALYRLTNSCLLSRYVFPGHLNMANENSARALGVDPSLEVTRILAKHPAVVVVDDPPFERVNENTLAIVRRELRLHYVNTFAMRTGDRRRLVFRRKG